MSIPPNYPGQLTTTWPLKTGEIARLRGILPEDLAMETAFVNGLSKQAAYQRLLSPRTPDPAELHDFTHVDYVRHMALVATIERSEIESMIAVARYVRDDNTGTAEFAIVVADAFQGAGVGSRLLSALVEAARDAGVRRLSDVTLAHNRGMLAIARSLGFTTRREPGDATLTRLTLDF